MLASQIQNVMLSLDLQPFVAFLKAEIEMKRHNRDKHDKTTCSTSPKPKKPRKGAKEELID